MIDSHCHLDFDAFDNRRDQVVADAERAGVNIIVNIGIDVATSRRSVELAERYDAVYAAVGIHPHDANTFDRTTTASLKELARHPKVVAIGEIGLDYYRDLSPRETQRKVFRNQLELATELDLPVVIHSRESLGETISIVEEYALSLPGGVFHCFPGDVNDACAVFDLGFVISVGGVITFKNSRMSRVASEVPLDNILLETDAPFLAPEPFRGKTNCPAYVTYVCRKLAELRHIPGKEAEETTDRTCRKTFRLAETFGG
jgi:TatD DNase family protein